MSRQSLRRVRTLVQTLIVPVASGVVLAGSLLLRGSSWSVSLEQEPLAPLALIVDGASFGVGALAVAMILAWLWDLPHQIGHAAIQRAAGEENTFIVLASLQLQQMLSAVSKYGFERKPFLTITASISPTGLTFWRGTASPAPVSTVGWFDIYDFRAGSAACEVRFGVVLPDGSRVELSESVREPRELGFWYTTQARRDALVSAATAMRARAAS